MFQMENVSLVTDRQRVRERETDRQTDRQTDRHIEQLSENDRLYLPVP